MRKGQARGNASTPSPYAKSWIADSMYQKGTAFIGAAILLKQLNQRSHPEYVDSVFLHLLCQGVELVLKSLLLRRDFNMYHPYLKKVGHNLVKLSNKTSYVYGINPMRKPLADELSELNKFYSQHLLRYGTMVDIFINPHSIQRLRVFRRLRATIRLAEKTRP